MPPKPPGRKSLFRGKVRAPVSITLTPAHHRWVARATRRLTISRSDLIGLLIDKHARTVEKAYPDAYRELVHIVEAMGGTLRHQKAKQPRGGSWILKVAGRCRTFPSQQAETYPALDACYKLKPEIVPTGTWNDQGREIDLLGLAELLRLLDSDHSDELSWPCEEP